MTQKVDVASLAKLARLEVSAEELQKLETQIPEILAFVETIQTVSDAAPVHEASVRNVMREDANPHESGMYTRDLVDAAPAQKDDQISVLQVISK